MVKAFELNSIKERITNNHGLGTVEIVIITAILVGLALMFREYITSFLKLLFDNIFKNAETLTN